MKSRTSNLVMQERVMNVLIGAVSGMGGSAITKESLSMAAEKMREIATEDSKKFPGAVDSKGKVLSNLLPGRSEGVRGDGRGIAGTRADLDLLCGADNSRCAIQRNPDGTAALVDGKTVLATNENKQVIFLGDFDVFMKTDDGKKMAGPFGGVQGFQGTLFGVPYKTGSWQDKLLEAFGGTHDFIGSKLTGLYDEQGNIKRGMSEAERSAYDKWVATSSMLSAPFAAAELFSPEIWKAISVFLQAAK